MERCALPSETRCACRGTNAARRGLNAACKGPHAARRRPNAARGGPYAWCEKPCRPRRSTLQSGTASSPRRGAASCACAEASCARTETSAPRQGGCSRRQKSALSGFRSSAAKITARCYERFRGKERFLLWRRLPENECLVIHVLAHVAGKHAPRPATRLPVCNKIASSSANQQVTRILNLWTDLLLNELKPDCSGGSCHRAACRDERVEAQ